MIRLITAFSMMIAMATFTNASELDKVIKASPQLNENCSSSVIYSKRDEKSGDVKTVLLTANHCVRDNPVLEQKIDFPVYKNGKIVKKDRYLGKVLGQAYDKDLALVELKDKDTLFENVVKIAKDVNDVQIGDPVAVIGYPLGLNLTVTNGNYVGYQTTAWDGKEFLRATPDMIFGNSGGALFKINKDGTYEQIGVTDAIMTPMGVPISYMGLYVPVDQIREYLKVALPEAIGEKNTTIVSPNGK